MFTFRTTFQKCVKRILITEARGFHESIGHKLAPKCENILTTAQSLVLPPLFGRSIFFFIYDFSVFTLYIKLLFIVLILFIISIISEIIYFSCCFIVIY